MIICYCLTLLMAEKCKPIQTHRQSRFGGKPFPLEPFAIFLHSTRRWVNAPPSGVKTRTHRVIPRHHLVQFFGNPGEIFLSRHRCIYSDGNESTNIARILSKTTCNVGQTQFAPAADFPHGARSIPRGGVSCCGAHADLRDARQQPNIDRQMDTMRSTRISSSDI